jgi:hypothetical protein
MVFSYFYDIFIYNTYVYNKYIYTYVYIYAYVYIYIYFVVLRTEPRGMLGKSSKTELYPQPNFLIFNVCSVLRGGDAISIFQVNR